ncbi:LytTR family DNA-binding domain-containing protein [Pelomonas sp. SE-A7]|uniref:LytR/AlgR family response regulator transcription factor n=1 Tax=Pelomonas sp. SE-A7 TaxID=3054953 RepID=UPI00259D0A4A|nr:LytTR family DNA-binding domain-containing protein [Pelomonas sp. SE-A7]MDM4765074.1 LytTR family DNA-binding domain-containing protein [Pelomonas sp. SE-A7]
MTRALIADDETHLADYLRSQLQQLWPELEIVALARNGDEAAKQIAELSPELAFLDIQMPGLTGLEVAEGIEGPTRVVFVTAFDEYAVEAFEHAALDYVLKPIKTERLARTVERLKVALATPAEPDASLAQALHKLQAPAAALPRLRYIRASQGELMHQIDVREVRFFHADDKYTCVQTADAEYLIRTTIADLVAQLDPDEFMQIHRSTVINLAHLSGTRRDEASRLFVRVKGFGRELPVSRAYVHLFKAM